MTGAYGPGRAAVMIGAVAMDLVLTYGIMHKLFRICFLHWREACDILSFVKIRVLKDIRLSELISLLVPLNMIFTLLQMDSLAES